MHVRMYEFYFGFLQFENNSCLTSQEETQVYFLLSIFVRREEGETG